MICFRNAPWRIPIHLWIESTFREDSPDIATISSRRVGPFESTLADATVTQGIRIALSIAIAIALYSPSMKAIGKPRETKISGPAKAVHLSKVQADKSNVAKKDKSRVAKKVRINVAVKSNNPQQKAADGQQLKPATLSDKVSHDVSPTTEKNSILSVVNSSDVARASISGADGPIEVPNVNSLEHTEKAEIYATVIKIQEIYVPQKPGCDAIKNYRQFRLSDADDWRTIACMQAPESASFGLSE